VHLTLRRGLPRLFPLVSIAWLLTCAPARAEVAAVEGVEAPIVRVQIPAQANLIVRTWDRSTVQVEGDSSAYVIERTVSRFAAMMPPQLIRVGQTKGPDGMPITLPAESFVISSLPPGPRNVVVVKGEAGHPVGTIVVTVPNNSPLVTANVARGSVVLQNYQNGTFIIHLNNGPVLLDSVGGDGFVQVLHGSLVADDSNFNRLRARTAVGAQIFERCNARQIEASVASGSIVYDNGHFDAGLARFDAVSGNVAIGTTGASQLSARVGTGHVYTLFDRRAQVDGRDTEATALVEGGGPVVTATSANGNVYLYDGSLRTKSRVPAEWRPAQAALRRESFGVPSKSALPPVTPPQEPPKKNEPAPKMPPPRGGKPPSSGGHRILFSGRRF
jgi:hypothetical protein